MTNDNSLDKNILGELSLKFRNIMFEEKNPSSKNILKLEDLNLEKFRKIDILFGETLETCRSCLELVTELSERGQKMSGEKLRDAEKLFEEQVKLIEIGIKRILQKFPKYQYYGEYRERLLKIYYIIQRIVAIQKY